MKKETHREARAALRREARPAKARFLKSFFKSGPGEYAEGDVFLGLTVPTTRRIAKRFVTLPLPELRKLLLSKIHEERLLALVILVERYARGTEDARREIFGFYVANLRGVNNWDLVDCSAHHIVGAWLERRDKRLVLRWAASADLWERRVAMVSCFHEIRLGRMKHPLEVARRLVHDPEDLIQKAVGWMLREIGKRDAGAERRFLDRHAHAMPRTMLRYAIERFPESERRHYLGAKARRFPVVSKKRSG